MPFTTKEHSEAIAFGSSAVLALSFVAAVGWYSKDTITEHAQSLVESFTSCEGVDVKALKQGAEITGFQDFYCKWEDRGFLYKKLLS